MAYFDTEKYNLDMKEKIKELSKNLRIATKNSNIVYTYFFSSILSKLDSSYQIVDFLTREEKEKYSLDKKIEKKYLLILREITLRNFRYHEYTRYTKNELDPIIKFIKNSDILKERELYNIVPTNDYFIAKKILNYKNSNIRSMHYLKNYMTIKVVSEKNETYMKLKCDYNESNQGKIRFMNKKDIDGYIPATYKVSTSYCPEAYFYSYDGNDKHPFAKAVNCTICKLNRTFLVICKDYEFLS